MFQTKYNVDPLELSNDRSHNKFRINSFSSSLGISFSAGIRVQPSPNNHSKKSVCQNKCLILIILIQRWLSFKALSLLKVWGEEKLLICRQQHSRCIFLGITQTNCEPFAWSWPRRTALRTGSRPTTPRGSTSPPRSETSCRCFWNHRIHSIFLL